MGVDVGPAVEIVEPEAVRFASQVHVVGLNAEKGNGTDTDEGLPGGVVQVKVMSGVENVVDAGLADAGSYIGVGQLSVGGSGAGKQGRSEQKLAHGVLDCRHH